MRFCKYSAELYIKSAVLLIISSLLRFQLSGWSSHDRLGTTSHLVVSSLFADDRNVFWMHGLYPDVLCKFEDHILHYDLETRTCSWHKDQVASYIDW